MRLLDLFCGAGLAGWGYWRSASFSEIVGIDINPMPYPFDFIQGDALALDYDFLSMFDFIHASPPCQFYSKITPDRSKHERLIPRTHLMLMSSGKPYVIENVEGSGQDLRPNLVLAGDDVGLPILRRRYFHCSFMRSSPGAKVNQNMSIDDSSQIRSPAQINLSTGAYPHEMSSAASPHVVVHGGSLTKRGLIKAMGLDEMSSSYLSKVSMKHIEQGIPPRMTTKIIQMYTPKKFMIG